MQAKIVAERIENKVAKQRPEGTDINQLVQLAA